MRTQTRWAQWICVAAALAWLTGPPGAAAQSMAGPVAAPGIPGFPLDAVPLPPNCTGIVRSSLDNTPKPLIDKTGIVNGVVTATVTLTASLPYVYAVGAGVDISHTFSSDLDISLISPAGTNVTLSHRNGGSFDNVFAGTFWSDFAEIPTTDALYQDNVAQQSLVPEEAMGAFQGENGTGTWKLVISDQAPGDTGTLNFWGLTVESLAAAPVTTTTHHIHLFGSAPIPDGGTLDSNIFVSVPGHTLLNAKLTTDIVHPNPGQLEIRLGSPQSLTTTISTENGVINPNWFAGTLWDDKAGATYPPGPVTEAGVIYPTSPLTAAVPEGAMGHFLGSDPNGFWDLQVKDTVPGQTGSLDSWSLDLTTASCRAVWLPLVRR